jgi:hypothetical protein
MVSLKLLASELLLACPGYKDQYDAAYDPGGPSGKKTIYGDIFVPGEVSEETLKFREGVRVYASPHNPGTLPVVAVLQKAMQGLELSAAPPPTATHFLLYLSHDTFVGSAGERLAEEVRQMMRSHRSIVMLHENDMDNGGCEFSRFFATTPQDLIADGLYKALALAYYPGHFRPVSIALIAKKLGAVNHRSWRSTLQLSSSPVGTAKVIVQASKASSFKGSSTMGGTMDLSRDASASKSEAGAPWEEGVAAASGSTGGEQKRRRRRTRHDDDDIRRQKQAQDEPSAFQSAQRWEAAAAKEFEAGMGEEHGV